jgi:enamine deaminase RidA (YjgF/YER057c/UK114 family)
VKKEIIAPAGVPKPLRKYSPAVKAGNQVFLSGVMATDFEHGLAPEAQTDPRRPFHELPITRQIHCIYPQIRTLLEAAGSSLDNIVRLDQFFTGRDVVKGYFPARDVYLTRDRPASTAVEMDALPVADAVAEVDAFAIVPGPSMRKESINTAKVAQPKGGYSLAIRAGGWVWTAGASPTDFRSWAPYPTALGTAIAEKAQVDPNFWHGYEIVSQTEYVLGKLRAYLEAAGTDFDHVVKAQVYLADTRDYWGFQQVWREAFPERPPATTIIPIDRMAMSGSRVEISLIATMPGSGLEREVIETSRAPRPLGHSPQAIRAGDYLFLAGQLATDAEGKDPRATPDPRFPYYRSGAKAQMEVMLEHVEAICRAAGGSLANVVKTQLFYTDLHELAPSFDAWEAAFATEPPAATMVGITGPHFVPDCTIGMDVFAAL